MTGGALTFPLVPRRRLLGLSFGTMRSLRRGAGSEVAGSRPYRPGDDVRAIDWRASARLSLARGTDEFVVRERYADEAPRIVVLFDRRPQMAAFAPPFPWLDKVDAGRRAAELIRSSAVHAGGFVGSLDHADGRPHWRAPQAERRLAERWEEQLRSPQHQAPADVLAQSFALLGEHRRAVSAGTFLFVLSDFVPAPPEDLWLSAFEHGWDVVPVVIQDPTWERSFPDVSGIEVPLHDPARGRAVPVRLTRRECAARKEANEARFAGLLEGLARLDVDPVVLESADEAEILGAFLAWGELRRIVRRGGF